MYMQNNIVAAANPNFHIKKPKFDPEARTSEIEQVIALATARLTKAQLRKLGGFTFAAARDDDDYSYFAQIRSESIGTSGLEFRYPIPLRDMRDRDLGATAVELADGAVLIARNAAKLSNLSVLVRNIATKR